MARTKASMKAKMAKKQYASAATQTEDVIIGKGDGWLSGLSAYLALETGALYKANEEQHELMNQMKQRYEERIMAMGGRILQIDGELEERTAERDDLWEQLQNATTAIDAKDAKIRHLRGVILQLRSRNVRSLHHRAVVQQWAERMMAGIQEDTESEEMSGTDLEPTVEDLDGLSDF